jgi:hypothetical protein
MRRIPFIAMLAMAALMLTACPQESEAIKEDREAAEANLNRLNDAQPVPEFRWSQIRQNLIEITHAQAQTTQTTSFFFNLGVPDPISVCPSIGFPIPSTAQLTNPEQAARVGGAGGERFVIAQAEQTGIYTGDSTGTYVICVDAQGAAYAQYWEGFVSAVAGPAEWDPDADQIRLIGPPSFQFSEGEGDG